MPRVLRAVTPAVRAGLFATLCEQSGLPRPGLEWRFAAPRRWRFDVAWPAEFVSLEIQGGLFVQGRHSRGAALLAEHEKLNTAAVLGWRVLYTTPRQLCTSATIETVRAALG